MNVNYHISPYPSLLEDMLAIIYEVAPDGTASEVAQQAIPAPHTLPVSISFNGLDKVTHEVRLYGDPSATLLHRYQIQPTVDTVEVFTPIRFVIGDGGANTPVAGTNTYVNPAMIGLTKDDYVAFRSGMDQQETLHIINEPINGGFSLAQLGDVFSGDPAEWWTIQIRPVAVSTPVNDSVVGKQWGGTAALAGMVVDVSSAVTYTPAHLRHLIRLNGASAAYTFGTVDIPPIGYIFRVVNFGAAAGTGKVNFNNAPLLWGAGTVATINIPLYSAYEFVFDGTNWNCTVNGNVVIPPPAVSVLGKGVLFLGDVPPSTTYTITHNLGIGTNYMVLGSFKSNGTPHTRNDTLTWCWFNTLTNSFQISVQEIFGETQNASFAWMVVAL